MLIVVRSKMMLKKYISLFAFSVFALVAGLNEVKSMDRNDSSSDEEPRGVRVSKETMEKTSITLHNETGQYVEVMIKEAPYRHTSRLLATAHLAPKQSQHITHFTPRYPNHKVNEVRWYDVECKIIGTCQFTFVWGSSHVFKLQKDTTSPSGYNCEEEGG